MARGQSDSEQILYGEHPRSSMKKCLLPNTNAEVFCDGETHYQVSTEAACCGNLSTGECCGNAVPEEVVQPFEECPHPRVISQRVAEANQSDDVPF